MSFFGLFQTSNLNLHGSCLVSHSSCRGMTSERHQGKEMTTLANNGDGVSREKTGKWIETCAHTLPTPLFLPLYILIRGRLCPELSHIVRNFPSDWQANPQDMAIADFTPNLDSKTQNFHPTNVQIRLRLSNPDKEKNKQIELFI